MVLIQTLPQQQQEQQQQLQPALFPTFHPPDFKLIWGERSCCAAIQATTIFHFSHSLFSPHLFFFFLNSWSRFFQLRGSWIHRHKHGVKHWECALCDNLRAHSSKQCAKVCSFQCRELSPACKKTWKCLQHSGGFFFWESDTETEDDGCSCALCCAPAVKCCISVTCSLSAWMDVCLNLRSINTRRLQAQLGASK